MFVSTNYLASSLVQPVAQMQASLTQAVQEASTGQYADLGLQLGAQSGQEVSLRNQTGLLQGLTSSNAIVSVGLSTAQAALAAIQSSAQSALQSLAAGSNSADPGQEQSIGETSLQSLISAANTSSGGQYVFGGVNTAAAPMADYFASGGGAKTAIDQAFQTTFGFPPSDPAASTITASAMQNFLSGPFAAQFQGSTWTTNWSSASSTNTVAEISPGQFAQVSTNANGPAFQNLAQGYAMLTEFGAAPFSAAVQQTVASSATALISSAHDQLTSTQATLGAVQQRVTDANSSMSSQLGIIQTEIGTLDNVDPAATAVKINQLTSQLQTAYELTSRLHSLSLAQFLPTS